MGSDMWQSASPINDTMYVVYNHFTVQVLTNNITVFLPKIAYTCDRNGEKISTLIQQYHINFNFLSSCYYNASTVEALTAHSFVNYTLNIQLPPILTSLPELSSKELLECDRIYLNLEN